VRGKAPNLRVDITDYGYLYAGVRPLSNSDVHVRTYHFIIRSTRSVRRVRNPDCRPMPAISGAAR